MLCVVTMNIVILCAVMLHVAMVNVVLLDVVAPLEVIESEKCDGICGPVSCLCMSDREALYITGVAKKIISDAFVSLFHALTRGNCHQ